LLSVIESDNQQIRARVSHLGQDFRFVGYFTDNFKTRLVRESGQYYISHQFGTISHENARRLFH
jgi:hypothetical protein